MAFADDLVEFLANTPALGLTKAVTLFREWEPATPDAICAVFQTGGHAPEYAFGQDAVRYEHQTCAVHFRGAPDDTDGPRLKAQAAYLACCTVSAETVNGTFYHRWTALQPPFRINRDADERPVWGFNLLADSER